MKAIQLLLVGVVLSCLPRHASLAVTLVDSDTAALVSDDLRNLELSTSATDHVIEPMLPYHFQGILNDTLRDQVHDLGMTAVYNNAGLTDVITSTLQAEYDVRSPILQAAGLALSRDLTATGFWEIQEPSQNNFHYEWSDIEMDSSAAYGIQNLVTIQPYALWDQQAAGYSSNPDNDHLYDGGDYFVLKDNTGPGAVYNLTAYQNFLTQLASTYPQLTYYEIGNEVDGSDSPYANDGASYAELIAASRTALGNDLTLVNAGAIDIRFSFWSDFFAAGGGDDIDIFNIHYNVEKAGMESDFSVYQSSLSGYNNVLDTAGVSLPIWITEMGTYADDTNQTEEEQAAWHIKYFAYGAARGVTKFFIDVFGNNSETLGQSAMLYEDSGSTDWTARLLLYTAKQLNAKLSGFTACEELVAGEQYKFTVGDEAVYVLWGSAALPTELSDQTLMVEDIYGNVSYTASVILSDNPVFVTMDDTDPVATLTVPTLSTETSKNATVTIAWSGSDNDSVTAYDVDYRRVGVNNWTTWLNNTTRTNKNFHGKVGRRYQFRLRATDASGNTSSYVTANLAIPQDDDVLTYDDNWTTGTHQQAYQRSLHTAKTAQALATFTGAMKQLYIVAPTATRYGKIKVLVDGEILRTVNLRAKQRHNRKTILTKSWSKKSTHVISLMSRNQHTVAIDAWLSY